MSTILLTGSSNGLGAILSQKLQDDGHKVIGFDLIEGNDVRSPGRAAALEIDVLINNAGVNEINWLEDVEAFEWDTVMDTNVKGIFMMTKTFLPNLIKSKGTVLNIISNASHVPMTCSAAYNASKGAAEILTRQLARELSKRHEITVFGISPNKLAGTEMSKYIESRVPETRGWTNLQATQYQIDALLAGEETDPEVLAEFICYLLSEKERHKYLTGCVLEYGA